ncbi:MAG TPA: hypothetical protein VLG67_02080 [Candidatus Saccharimonadales bacterium]|nr:hypothetical protein [Candidatus Saccharimonadales bacterium]
MTKKPNQFKKVATIKKWHYLIFSFIILEIICLLYLVTYFNNPVKLAHTANSECKKSADKNLCYSKYFYTLTKKNDLGLARKTLIALQDIDPVDCHFIGHRIAQAETEKNPENWKNVIKKDSPSMCSGGFIHGALEVHLLHDPSFVINDHSIEFICKELIGNNPFNQLSCSHGMGHLLLVQFTGDINKASNVCENISDLQNRYECLSGVFMENDLGEGLFAHGIIKQPVKKTQETASNIEILCKKYSNIQSDACWKEISHLYNYIHKDDPKLLYKECQNAPTRKAINECFIHGALSITGNLGINQQNLFEICNQFEEKNPLFDNCMKNVIPTMLSYTFEKKLKVFDLCNSTYPSYRQKCYKQVLTSLI